MINSSSKYRDLHSSTCVLLDDVDCRIQETIAYLKWVEIPFLKRQFFRALRELGVDVWSLRGATA